MFKSFVEYYKPHLKLLFFDIFCALIVAFCNLFFPVLTKNIINDYVPNQKLNFLLIVCGALLCIYILKAGLNYFIQYWGHVLGVRMQGDMRRDMFRHIQKLPFTFFDSNKTGALMSRLVNDLQDVAELAHHGPEDIFISMVTLIGAFIIISIFNVYLMLIVLAVIPFIFVFAARTRVKMRKAYRKMREETARINAQTETSVTGIRVTRAYSNEKYEQDRFDSVNENFKAARSGAYKVMGSFHSGMDLITDVLYLTVLLAGGLFFFYGLINIGEFAAYILYIAVLIGPIKSLVNIYEQIQNGMTGFARFTEIMKEEPEKDSDGAEDLQYEAGDIVFEDVSFAYDGKKGNVLQGLSFTAEHGKMTALAGPSGCGKTTACHLLMRFYDPSPGRVTIGGKDIKSLTRSSLRDNIGIVAQDVFIFDGTIRENIAYGKLDAGQDEITGSASKAKIHEFVMSLPDGYDSMVGERGIKLSAGQRQRISIARAFLKNPPILILDEATSALDNITEAQIQEALEELSAGRTSIVVAHRLSTIRNADKIIIIDKGCAAEQGTHDELLQNNNIYAKMCCPN